MGTGIGVFLLAAGAVLTFAVDKTVNGLDLDAVGIILMIVGVIGLGMDLIVFGPRRRTSSTVVTQDPYAGTGTRVVRRDEIV